MKQLTNQKIDSIAKKTISSARPYFGEQDIKEILSNVQNVLQSGSLIIGPYVNEFEEKFAEYMGSKHALAVSSCTAALEISMRYYGIKNSEVVVPANTFIACPNSVVFAGGKPVFADIDPNTYSVNYETVSKQITEKTKGVMGVHLSGLPILDTKEIAELCHDRNIFLIEDCSHAHGATIGSRKVGTIGDAGCFSLMATKIITSGLGGMIVTNNDELYDYALNVRNAASGKFTKINYLASDWMMSEMAAVIGLQQLKNLDEFLATRKKIAEKYKEGLKGIDKIAFFEPPPHFQSAHYKFLIKLNDGIDKYKIIEKGKEQGIEIGTLYETPCNMHPLYQRMGYGEGLCPVAEEAMKHQISLPLNVTMTEGDVDTVVEFLRREIQ